MKTTLLTLTGILALGALTYAQNPKGGYTRPEIRPATPKAATCPMTTKERETHLAPFAKGSTATVTTTVTKHDPACQMPKGGHCSMK